MIKKRDRCKYRFDGPKCMNFSRADYLSDKDEFLMIFFGAIRSPKVSTSSLNFFYFVELLGSIFRFLENKSMMVNVNECNCAPVLT